MDSGDMKHGGLRDTSVTEPNYARTGWRTIYPDQRIRYTREDSHKVRDGKSDCREIYGRERCGDGVAQRRFGLRAERLKQSERVECADRSERHERTSFKHYSDHEEDKEHKSRDVSLDPAVLVTNAPKNKSLDNRDNRDNQDFRRRDCAKEPRLYLDSDWVDLGGRYSKERRRDDSDPPLSPRVSPPLRDGLAPKDVSPLFGPLLRVEEVQTVNRPQYPKISLNGRDPKERKPSKDFGKGARAFNPNDAMDLKAVKEALRCKDIATKTARKEPAQTLMKNSRDVARIRERLNERRPPELLSPTETPQPRVICPTRENFEEKPVKSILRTPRERFPEDLAPTRDGVAPLKDTKKDAIPPGARWTKISREMVNPEALEVGKERYEAGEDFVIALRVLSRDEIRGYVEVTQQIRGLSHSNSVYDNVILLTESATRKELKETKAHNRRQARRERRQYNHDHDRGRSSTKSRQDYEDDRLEGIEIPKKKEVFGEAIYER